MEQIQQTIQKILELAGFRDFKVDLEPEGRRLAIFINEGDWFKDWEPKLIADLTHLSRLIGNKSGFDQIVFIDINNYRKERERIIVDLARAAARKVMLTKAEVKLPAMNAYERRLIHTELAARPDVTTESAGERSNRCVVVKPLL